MNTKCENILQNAAETVKQKILWQYLKLLNNKGDACSNLRLSARMLSIRDNFLISKHADIHVCTFILTTSCIVLFM